ncbi:MAG: hypothetical protein MHPSP_001975, partial [Paramarteilia canceri]
MIGLNMFQSNESDQAESKFFNLASDLPTLASLEHFITINEDFEPGISSRSFFER